MKKFGKHLSFTAFEICLWSVSALVTVVSYIISPEGGFLNFLASFIGVTAIMFVAKGQVFGQMLSCVFALLYGYISFRYNYYGELITYMCMSFPMSLFSVISWLKNPYKDSGEVAVARLTKKKAVLLCVLTAAVTAVFYFILEALNTNNLIVSTISVASSFGASALTFLRSPYYALVYAANDVILVVLWSLAALEEPSYAIMVVCFVTFLVNDMYGFVNWLRMRKRQTE